MEVKFRKPELRKQYQDFDKAKKAYGIQTGKKYIQRIDIIKNAKNFHMLRDIQTLKCHELKGDRKGYWTIRLTRRDRLIITLAGESLEIVIIEEVSKHYGD